MILTHSQEKAVPRRYKLASTPSIAQLAQGAKYQPKARLRSHGAGVRLFIHNDDAGDGGKDVRKQQLLPVAGHLDGATFDGFKRRDGAPIKDLNDLCLLGSDDYEARREFIENLMFF